MKLNTKYSALMGVAILALSSASGLAQQNFEPPFAVTAANSIGDVGVRGTYQGLTPPQGSNQLLLTTINNSAGSDPTSGGAPANQSGTNAVSSVSLATFLGIPSGTIRNGTGAGSAAGNEGSAFKLTITLAVGQILTFNYQFLTQEDVFGPSASYHRDFAFASLTLGGSLVNYTVIDTADNALITPPSTSPFPFAADPKVFTFTATTAGTYTLGIGVADANTMDIASGLLIDNIRVIPEPSTVALAVFGVAVLVGVNRRRRKTA